MRADRRAVLTLTCLVPLAIGLWLPQAFWDQGCIEVEALTFIQQYRAERPVLQRVFDPHANDFGTYQARELSYAIDLVDAWAHLRLGVLFGDGWLIPLSALLTTLMLVAVIVAGTWRMRRLPPDVVALLLSAFVTSFVFVSTMGLYYRSAKPVLAVVTAAATFLLLGRPWRRDPAGARAEAVLLCALAAVAGLLDRQGVYLVGVAMVMLALHWRWTGEGRNLLVATVSAFVGLQVYNAAIAPVLVHTLNGYWPTFEYQAIPMAEWMRLPGHAARAVALFAMNAAGATGGPIIGVVTVAGAAGVLVWRTVPLVRLAGWRIRELDARLREDRAARIVACIVIGLGLQVVMFALMITRHPDIYSAVDHRHWYYPLPTLGLGLAGAMLLAGHQWPRLTPVRRVAARALLVLVIAGNGLSLGHYRRVMEGGPWFASIARQCEALKTSLRRGTAADALDDDFRAFFTFTREQP